MSCHEISLHLPRVLCATEHGGGDDHNGIPFRTQSPISNQPYVKPIP